MLKITSLQTDDDWVADFFPNKAVRNAQKLGYRPSALARLHDYFRNENRHPAEKIQVDSKNFCVIYKLLLEMEDINELLCFPFKQYIPQITKGRRIKRYEPQITKGQQCKKNNPQIVDLIMVTTSDFNEDEQIVAVVMPTKLSNLFKNIFDIYLRFIPSHYKEEIFLDADVRNKKNNVVFECPKKFPKKNCHQYRVMFFPSRIPIRFQYNALEILSVNDALRQYLFPTTDSLQPLPSLTNHNKNETLKFINENIEGNPEQVEAIQRIINGPQINAPFIIFGPPGTGKTATIVEAVLQLVFTKDKNRILITAGTNSACDNIALRIAEELNKLNQPKNHPEVQIIRMYSKKNFYKSSWKDKDARLKEISNFQRDLNSELLSEYRIIVCTLCMSGVIKLVLNQVDFFTHLFIDEVAASSEPEALIAITGTTSANRRCRHCHVIIAGDHKQLGPVIKAKEANKFGLGQSLMDRLMARECYRIDPITGDYDRRVLIQLRRNYRSHAEIVRLYNHLYYDNRLIPMLKEEKFHRFDKWNLLANKSFPIIFEAAYGQNIKENSSYGNSLEVDAVGWYLRRLLIDRCSVNGITEEVKPEDIGIITPYIYQRNLIKSRLKAKDWTKIETGSVEAFQGREKPIIIISLVRSFDTIGFVADPRRLNVMLSRAISLLIIIGNPSMLKRNKDYSFIIKECKKKGTMRIKPKSKGIENKTKSGQSKNTSENLTANMKKLQIA